MFLSCAVFIYNLLWWQGLSTFTSEPLLIGISVSSIEKAYRGIDIGPNPENKEEVRWWISWGCYANNMPTLCKCVCITVPFSIRLWSFGSFGEKKQSLEDLKMAWLQRAYVRVFAPWPLLFSLSFWDNLLCFGLAQLSKLTWFFFQWLRLEQWVVGKTLDYKENFRVCAYSASFVTKSEYHPCCRPAWFFLGSWCDR